MAMTREVAISIRRSGIERCSRKYRLVVTPIAITVWTSAEVMSRVVN
jgi:hypothetical protein